MHADDGGFFSAEDAQVAGVDGASYVWRRSRIEELLGAADASRFFTLYTLIPVPASPAAGENESPGGVRSEEHTSELQSLMRISYAVFCLKKKKKLTRCLALSTKWYIKNRN